MSGHRGPIRGNKMWGGSRFMLPEHQEGLILRNREQALRGRPIVDEDSLEVINRLMTDAVEEGSPIRVRLYSPLGDQWCTLIIKAIYGHEGALKAWDLEEQRLRRVSLEDVMEVE